MNYHLQVQEIIEIGRRMHQGGYIVGTEGNISVRVSPDEILITASGKRKGEMQPEDVVIVDANGQLRAGDGRVSTEVALHLEVYRQRSDVQAVIHAHPPYCIALMLSGRTLDVPILPESVILLGKVPRAKYARPSTRQVPDSIRPFIRQTDVVLLDRHGSLTVGQSLEEAFLKLEALEHAAKVYWMALQVGEVTPLPWEEVKALMELRQSTYGIHWPIIAF
ncbi:MAG: class II aldolase/adducin family protein [Calditrichaeota bacterium]|nr:class II aldolase/adducin family protein [Calditrichota bacterium]